MKHTAFGRTGLDVSAIGLGCMGMSENYGPSDDAQNLEILGRALELGINFLDTADSYGPFRNEELIGRFLAGRRARVSFADCSRRHCSTLPWSPLVNTAGISRPSNCAGRVYCGYSRTPFSKLSSALLSSLPSTPGISRTTASSSTMAATSPPAST